MRGWAPKLRASDSLFSFDAKGRYFAAKSGGLDHVAECADPDDPDDPDSTVGQAAG